VGGRRRDRGGGVVFHGVGWGGERWKAVLAAGGEGADRAPATKVAFAYTGQGSQWPGMGRTLYENERVARAVMDRCEAVFREELGASLLDVMFGRVGTDRGDLGDTAWEQPALYTLESALTALWSSVGIRPSVVVGHSVGEIAAAQAAGVFSLEDGMRFACARGALMSGMEAGAMAAVFAPPERVQAAVDAWNAASDGVGVNISADNGAHQVVSGPAAGVEAVSAQLEADELRVRRLNTAKAFHSGLVEPILDALEASIGDMEIAQPSLTVVSNLTGRAMEPRRTLDGAYWRRHARQAVAFAGGVRTLAELGVDLLVEIGPRPVLAPMALSAWPESPDTPAPRVLSSLQPPADDAPAIPGSDDFIHAVAEAYEAGLPIRFEGLFRGESRRRISVPSYPFQRTHHWLDAPKRRRALAGHPLLGDRHESARGEITFETELFPSDPPWLDDHRVFDRVIAPGALYGAMAASAALAEGDGTVVVEDFQLHNALVFSGEDPVDGDGGAGRQVQLVLDESDEPSRAVQIYSKGSEGGWTQHVEGRVASGGAVPEAAGRLDLDGLRSTLSPVDVEGYYRARADTGVHLGPSFRTLGKAWSRPGEALSEVRLPEGIARDGLEIHPLLLDGCFQTVGTARDLSGPHGSVTYLPFGWERFWLTTGRLPDRVVCHVRLSEGSRDADTDEGEAPEVLTAELRIYNRSGVQLGGLSGYTIKRATRAALLSAVDGVKDLLYEVQWRERALPPGMPSADFFPTPGTVKAGAQLFTGYLTDAGVDPDDRDALLADLETWSWSYALATLDRLGWRRQRGALVDAEELRERLEVSADHPRLFRRMLEMVARAGVLREEDDSRFAVLVGSEDPWPEDLPRDPDDYAAVMADRYPNGLIEVGLFRRSGGALAKVLRGREDPLTLLFSSGEPTAADLYLKAPVARAANEMLAEAVRALVATQPEGRRLRIVEVGGGDRVGDRIRSPRTSGRAIRLRLHRYLRGFLRRGRGAIRGRWGMHRIPSAGYREGSG